MKKVVSKQGQLHPLSFPLKGQVPKQTTAHWATVPGIFSRLQLSSF